MYCHLIYIDLVANLLVIIIIINLFIPKLIYHFMINTYQIGAHCRCTIPECTSCVTLHQWKQITTRPLLTRYYLGIE